MNGLNRNLLAVIVVALLILPSLPALAFAEQMVLDLDLWWHLRTGEWVAEHGVPQTDSFSEYGAGKLWVSYSWLTELVMYASYAAFGLAGVPVFLALAWVAILAAWFGLLHRLQPSLLLTITLVVLVYYALSRLYSPRPWLGTILLVLLELDLLRTAGRRRDFRFLLLLPPLFVLWTNFHIQFLNGLIVLFLALVESAAAQFLRVPAFLEGKDVQPSNPSLARLQPLAAKYLRLPDFLLVDQALPFYPLLLVAAACFGATFLTPYHYHTYEAAFDLSQQKQFWALLLDLQAMGFRSAQDWVVLVAALVAAFAIGYQRQVRLFSLLLYLAGVYFAFYSIRHAWFGLLASLLVVAEALPTAGVERVQFGWQRSLAMGAAVLVAVAALAWTKLDNQRLAASVAKNYPDRAIAFIDEQGYPGPIAQHVAWGGYWMWRQRRLPATMDWRTTVHGEERIIKHLDNWNGLPGWQDDPELRAARVVLVQRRQPLGELLRRSPDFEKVYEDEVALVFVRK